MTKLARWKLPTKLSWQKNTMNNTLHVLPSEDFWSDDREIKKNDEADTDIHAHEICHSHRLNAFQRLNASAEDLRWRFCDRKGVFVPSYTMQFSAFNCLPRIFDMCFH